MRWWSRLLRGRRLEEELDAELRDHLDRQVEAAVRSGMTEGEARRRARDRFGGLEQIKEECRDVRGTRWVEETVGDLRLACRSLSRNAPFATAATLSLALAIGMNGATYGAVEAVLVRPLPFRDPGAVVWISEQTDGLETVSGAHLEAWREHARSLEVLSPLLAGDAELDGDADRVRFAGVSAELDRLFGVTPAIGRDFAPADFDDAPVAPGLRAAGGGATGVAILSDRLFRRLGASNDLVGRPLSIRGVSYAVIGVLPTSFHLPVPPSLQLGVGPRSEIDLFLGTSVDRAYRGPGAALGRLAPGRSIAAAADELESLARHVALPAPSGASGRLRVIALQERIAGDVRRTLLMLWAGVGFVLLIACANVGGMLLARLAARRREISVRVALGAGRWRLARQLLAESAVLALGAGVVGLALAWVGVAALARTGPADVPRLHGAALSPGVLLACAGAATLTVLLLSLVPALRSGVASTPLAPGRVATPGSRSTRRWQAAVVVAEIALTLPLLAGAGLMLRSLLQVHGQGAALAPEQVLAARVRPGDPGEAVPAPDRLRRNLSLLEQLEALPGVLRAALWTVTFGFPARVEALPGPPEPPVAMWFNVSPGFREASGVRLVAGRWLDDADREARPPAVVVSERFARAAVRGGTSAGDLVGRTALGPFPPLATGESEGPVRIVGVVSDYRSGQVGILQPDDPLASPQVFYLDALRPIAGGELLVRTASEPGALLASIRATVARDSGLRLLGGIDLADQISRALAPRRFYTGLFVWFAAAALLLVGVGIGGALWYSVTQRRGEIAVRLVLGARPADIRRMVLSQAGALLIAGFGGGLLGAVVVSRSIGAMLYGVEASDPTVYLAVASLLALVALCAASLPARRAMRTSPWHTLRRE